MKQSELKKLASKIWALEEKCQNRENISEAMQEMYNIANKLSPKDLILLDEYIENNLQK